MSREIKFRAFVNEIKLMGKVCELYCDGGVVIDNYEYPLQPSSIELTQYTGLKDKDGKEIYEGDIVRAFSVCDMVYDYCFEKDNDPTKFYEIVFNDGCFQFKGEKQWSDGSNDWRSIENVELFKVEVIGNIYENPELLTGMTTK